MNVIDIFGSLLGAVVDGRLALGDLGEEVREKVARIPADLNEYGYDPWGYSPDAFASSIVPAAIAYRRYFRCETTGLEKLPTGKMLLIGNHAGQVAFDGAMVTTAMVLDAEPPRLARGMGEYWLGTLPWINVAMERTGSAVGTRQTCVDMLNAGECVMAFPEGVRGMNKVFSDAYKLMEFGHGFMRLALETRAPIVPVSIVGSEEQQPGIANLEGLGRLFGMPAFPITPTFPWLGPLGMLPLPVKYHIEFGDPMLFEGDPFEENDVIGELVEQVKNSIRAGLDRGRARRRGIFF